MLENLKYFGDDISIVHTIYWERTAMQSNLSKYSKIEIGVKKKTFFPCVFA